MKVTLKKIKVRDLVEDYNNDLEEGVVGYGGKLDIRPAYQREFVYDEKQQQAVISTITKNYPLNVMYWAVNNIAVNEDNKLTETENHYEIIDGQQRTLSICRYINGDFSYDNMYFDNLWDEEQEQILDYELDIYLCEGTESEKLEWFKTINIAGEKLTEQELRNAVYHGPFVTEAKKYFSKTGCPAYQMGSDYLNGSTIRQDYLETIIKWISENEIEDYMGKNQYNKDTAEELWNYFNDVLNWVKKVFPEYRAEMKGLPWGVYYKKYKDVFDVDSNDFDNQEIEIKIKKLMQDEDVTSKKGVYEYIFTNNPKHLNIRLFTSRQKRVAHENQNGICVKCGEEFDIKEMEADHIVPWSKGGQTIQANCQLLCKTCNATKSNN